MTTTGPDHHLAAARATAAEHAPPTTAALFDRLSATLNELEEALGGLRERLSPVLTEEAPMSGELTVELQPRTDLARRLADLTGWASRLQADAVRLLERIEL